MKLQVIKAEELDSKSRLTASSYMLEDHELEVSALIVVRSKRRDGRPINPTDADRIKVKFTLEQVREIARAQKAKSVDEVREHVVALIKNNIVHALTEATRKT